MDWENGDEKDLGRREVLWGMACLGLAAASIPGCGGGGSAEEPGANGLPATATIKTGEIGGTGLSLLNQYLGEIAVKDPKSTPFTVAAGGAQVHVIVDGDRKPRGLSISQPVAGSSVLFDAASTAEALVFLSPGIATSDATVAGQRRIAIRGLAAFGPLRTFLIGELPSRPLNLIVSNAEYLALLEACVEEWGVEHRPLSAAAANPKVTFAWNSALDSVKATNSGWRAVHIVRQNLTPGPTVVELLPRSQFKMSGVTPLSMGSIFSGTLYAKTTHTDPVSQTVLDNAGSLKYWIYGLGWSDGEAPPAGVTFDKLSIWGITVIATIVVPILDVVFALKGGKRIDPANVWAIAALVYEKVKGSVSLGELVNAPDPGKVLDFVIEVLSHGSSYLSIVGAAAGAVGPMSTALLVIGILLAKGNMVIAALEYGTTPKVASVSLQVPRVHHLVIEPASATMLIGSTKLFSVRAEDAQNRTVAVEPASLKWSDGGAVTVPNGATGTSVTATAGSTAGLGTVTVKLDGTTLEDSAEVTVTDTPIAYAITNLFTSNDQTTSFLQHPGDPSVLVYGSGGSNNGLTLTLTSPAGFVSPPNYSLPPGNYAFDCNQFYQLNIIGEAGKWFYTGPLDDNPYTGPVTSVRVTLRVFQPIGSLYVWIEGKLSGMVWHWNGTLGYHQVELTGTFQAPYHHF